jgi:hypothetical protein
LNITGDKLTLSAWVKGSPTGPNQWNTIINKSDDNQYRLQLSTDGTKFEFAIRRISGNSWVTSLTSTDPDNWTHVAGVYDGTTMKIYINGIEENSSNFSGNLNIPATTRPLYIGARYSAGRRWDCDIDQVMIFSRDLNSSEILNMYNDQFNGGYYNGDTNGLVGYWKFDDNVGVDIPDSSDNNNNGILHPPAQILSSGGEIVLSTITIEYDGDNTLTILKNKINHKLIINGDTSINGSIKISDDSDTASIDKAGTIRYREDSNNSYVDICVRTGETTYEWKTIEQNNW